MPRLLVASLLACLILAVPASAQAPRIIGGADVVDDGDLPWTVALVQAGARGFLGQFCGGTLVADANGGATDVVVTAAHCVEDATAEDIEVLAGVSDLSAASENDYYAIDSIAVAPGTTFPQETLASDLAILKLAAPVTGVEPVEGIAAEGTPPSTLRVSGWGDTLAGPGVSFPDRLKFVDLTFMDDTACGSVWLGSFDADTMLCAIDPGQDSCNGDSGGPLTTIGANDQVRTGWRLVGAVSFGSDFCDEDDVPGVYADLTTDPLRSWALRAVDADMTNDPSPQPEHVSGAPVISGLAQPGSTLTCLTGTTVFSGGTASDPRQVALNVVNAAGAAVVGGATYQVTSADLGKRFACRARATLQTGGGSAVAYSTVSDTVRAPTTVEVPGPSVQVPVPVPGPTVVQPVPVPFPVPTPRVDDDTPPKIAKVTRTCTRSRRCTFTVRASDASPSAGVTSLSATATTIRARTCRKKGRRTVCASVTSRDLTVRRKSNGTFTVTTPKPLPKGTHTLVLVAADANGNVQAKPHRTSFRVR